jgi:nucleoside-specific outer membrane channel protein Tsx
MRNRPKSTLGGRRCAGGKGMSRVLALALFAAGSATSATTQAADWSDTYIGYRYGTTFAEPFLGNDISKNIFNLGHVSGYKYGTNFFNADILLSDSDDPASVGSSEGAHEVYIVYRHTLELGKTSGKSFKFGPVKDVGLTAGFDYNNKNDAGYNSKKHMLVAGPTLMMDVPGFLNVSLLALWESNAPNNLSRYSYDTHPMMTLAWGIPISTLPLSFEGFANFIASKGRDEFGNKTKAETNIDMALMLDVGAVTGGPKNTFKVGLEYQYWKNKFGVDSKGPAGSGAFAKTPMIRAEYHF